jgi:hypothetical protein
MAGSEQPIDDGGLFCQDSGQHPHELSRHPFSVVKTFTNYHKALHVLFASKLGPHRNIGESDIRRFSSGSYDKC